MLGLLLGFFGLASAQCLKSQNNAANFDMNEYCYHSGKCVNIVGIPASIADGFDTGSCNCCDPYLSTSVCYQNPLWTSGAYSHGPSVRCEVYTYYLYSIISYIIHIETYDATGDFVGREGQFKCGSGPGPKFVGIDLGDPGYQSTPDMLPMVQAIANTPEYWTVLSNNNYQNYPGKIVAYFPNDIPNKDENTNPGRQHCRICQASPNDCVTFTDGVGTYYGPENAGGHLMLSFATDFNTYYGCPGKAGDVMPKTEGEALGNPGCPANTEKGLTAFHVWTGATQGSDNAGTHAVHYGTLAQQPTGTPVGSPEYPVNGFGWNPNQVQLEKVHIAYKPEVVVRTKIHTLSPTRGPTPSPTPPPTDPPVSNDCFAWGYTHPLDSLKFKGIAEAGSRGCRHGLETSWPGGLSGGMCNSPYVVCLPSENTPNVGFPMGDGQVEAYLSDTAPYTLDQCKRECAFDQRCTGFEFYVPDGSGQAGLCSLIDDIPVEMGTTADGSIATEADLLAVSDWSSLAGRICYEKEVTCHPYFSASDLSDRMLTCYCPNNRKGFYTKKVHRTFEATKYCGSETGTEVTDRIKEAQANRMFHLCENWCLFNTQTPRTESWYHDPWKKCWREQYAGIGTHRSYCYRVIRDPMTIEQYWIDTRSANICTNGASGGTNSDVPTKSPVDDGSVTYYLAPETDSCDDTCAAQSMRCALDQTNMVNGGMVGGNSAGVQAAFMEAGIDCSSSFSAGKEGWAFPGVDPTGNCVVRNDATADTPCNLAIGVGYRRLCACT